MLPLVDLFVEHATRQFGLGFATRRALNSHYRYELTVLLGPWFVTMQFCRTGYGPIRRRPIRHSTR